MPAPSRSSMSRLSTNCNVLLREIEPGFDVGEQVQQIARASRATAASSPPASCASACCSSSSRVRFDHAEDGLGLRQVLLAGEKRPHREFARPGGTGAGVEQCRNEQIDQRRRRDGVNLDAVLTGVALRAGHVDQRRPAAASGRRADAVGRALRRATLGVLSKMRRRCGVASGPLRRTIARAPGPGADASATMVSSREVMTCALDFNNIFPCALLRGRRRSVLHWAWAVISRRGYAATSSRLSPSPKRRRGR